MESVGGGTKCDLKIRYNRGGLYHLCTRELIDKKNIFMLNTYLTTDDKLRDGRMRFAELS